MAYKKKTWQEKMANKNGLPKIIKLNGKEPCFKALQKMGAKVGDSCVITNPRDVEEIMNSVPKGKLITIREICQKLAKIFNAQFCCTLTTGIFITIVANAAEEAKTNTPYWRTLKTDGSLNEKYPGGQEKQKKLLEKEGHKVIKKGKKYKVIDFEKYLLTSPTSHTSKTL